MKKFHGYKNTSSSKGSPVKYEIKALDIIRVNVWFNMYGNPSYGFIMSNGDTYLLIDDYGAMNDVDHLSRRNVNRKKDLI